jgi:hypothetical protein
MGVRSTQLTWVMAAPPRPAQRIHVDTLRAALVLLATAASGMAAVAGAASTGGTADTASVRLVVHVPHYLRVGRDGDAHFAVSNRAGAVGMRAGDGQTPLPGNPRITRFEFGDGQFVIADP